VPDRRRAHPGLDQGALDARLRWALGAERVVCSIAG